MRHDITTSTEYRTFAATMMASVAHHECRSYSLAMWFEVLLLETELGSGKLFKLDKNAVFLGFHDE